MRIFLLALTNAALLLMHDAQAKLVEEVIRVPVEAANLYGKATSQEIVVTLFRDDASTGPQPLAIINHGRAAEAKDRIALGRARYSAVSRWLASLGFVVALPTRIGYGESGGDDVEDSGSCNAKKYGPSYAAGIGQVVTVMEALRKRPDVEKERTLVIGQSFGGAMSIGIAALAVPGVQAAINFAGGGGGNPIDRPANPCGQHQMKQLFASYGATARLPTLWIYTENDKYWGPALPREWFDAFRAAGGNGEFVRFPAHGENGHGFFSAAPAEWRSTVLDFLRKNGYPTLGAD
ncbi:Dienelactone hydrolase [Noviherbaspirillum humi]|uniref:Dienelactone hydrolase n=1 Tax=Noviherbaspirillum humi TaxID=1688639 RepID=A0A239DHG8_9BURK|nr:dienelactone hydrolase family protein [Noviherbaspirillum humi]SNS31288.1 Dienelactone hydrolase [Noviherbaspirillum humi]